MKKTIKLESEFNESFRNQKVAGMFDVPVTEKLTKEIEVDLPIEDLDWNVGLIVGSSGSGKTTIAKHLFDSGEYFTENSWSDNSILDDFADEYSPKEITSILTAVGFSSPPSWLIPYAALSNGQKFRADMARVLIESKRLIVMDEFTSVVDRTVAKTCSHAVSKHVKQTNKQFVAVSCHRDIAEWLEPDWIYDVDEQTFTRGSLRRPEIKLRVERVHHSAWRMFRDHHSLDRNLNISARCYVAFWDDEPVAFTAALKFPHATATDIWKSSRVVVLPDYQGIGIGGKLSEMVGEHFHNQESPQRYVATLSHPALISHRVNSDKWKMTKLPGNSPAPGKTSKVTGQAHKRLTASFEYIPHEKRSS